MERPGRQSTRAAVRRRLGWLAAVLALPFASIRSQIVLLVVLATLLISGLATWVAAVAIEDFLEDRLAARFPVMLEAKAREVRLWYDRIALDLGTFASHPTVARTVSTLVERDDGEARRALHVHLFRVLSRFNRYHAFLVCGPGGRPLVGVGTGFEIAAGKLARTVHRGRPRSQGVVARDGERRQMVSTPAPGAPGASLRAMIDLGRLDRLLATGITREAVELYVISASGRYLAGTMDPPSGTFFYRGPGPEAGHIDVYDNGRGRKVIGAARPVGRFGWTIVIEQDHAATAAPVTALLAEVFRIDLVIALLLVLIAVALALSIVRPLQALSVVADRVARGETDVDLPRPRGARELRRLTHAFNQMTSRLDASRRELERRADELQRLSITDGLTGLYNHRHFQERLPLEAKRAQRANQRLALILVDIDDFKAINDTFGHAIGDGILRRVAEVMTAEVRATDLVARYGGEEFGVLTQQKDEAGALTLAEKIRNAVAAIEYELPDGRAGLAAAVRTLQLTVSVGVGLHAPDRDTEAVFDAADAALYAAKLAGKNRVELGYGEDRRRR